MNPQERETYFDSYLSGKLSFEEEQKFTEQLENDPDLAAYFEEFRQAIDFVSALGAGSDMKEIILEEKAKKISIRKWVGYSVAATVIAILTFTFVGQQNEIDLMDEYFQPYRDVISRRGTQAPTGQAMFSYNRSDYEKAIEQFSNLEQKTDTVRLYRGISLLAQKQYDSALEDFRNIGPTSEFYLQKLWYQGLTFAVLTKNDSARHYLQRIEEREYNYDQAHALLRQLED